MSLSNHNQSPLLLIRSKFVAANLRLDKILELSACSKINNLRPRSFGNFQLNLNPQRPHSFHVLFNVLHQFNNSSRLTVEEVVTEPNFKKKTKPFTKISSRWKLSTPLSLRRLLRQFLF
ncbi:hypothetical protein PGT21_035976 [Puccinia graminis f. sp. tritici]|uniref:Uncharacterized protein n=1 Tax=Puccinia graminis f. sp. tritici TaxID=56615 RepID=A0A5B0NQI9_PUCGR|nr:hypothetical protein PGT21_035976 [Puccinia graminis f. sp. tritici]